MRFSFGAREHIVGEFINLNGSVTLEDVVLVDCDVVLQGYSEIEVLGSLLMSNCRIFMENGRSVAAISNGGHATITNCIVVNLPDVDCAVCGLRYIFMHPQTECPYSVIEHVMDA